MNCTKRWSHLAEGNQPCVPQLVCARSVDGGVHMWAQAIEIANSHERRGGTPQKEGGGVHRPHVL